MQRTSLFIIFVFFAFIIGMGWSGFSVWEKTSPRALPNQDQMIVIPTIQASVMRSFSGSKLPGEKYIALTFDDGPNPTTTPFLLDTLKTHGVKATFFVLGMNAQKFPDIIKREHDEGHEIGSHSWKHQNMLRMTSGEISEDRDQMDTLIYRLTGEYPYLYRPPYGLTNSGVQSIYGRPAILWSVDPKDWKYRNAVHNITAGESNIQDGSIILLHDIYSTSVEAVGPIISSLQSQGYTFVTVSELLSRNAEALTGTKICTLGNSCK